MVVDIVVCVGYGQSLIIGGIYCDELSVVFSKVFLFGDIFYFGVFFCCKSELICCMVWLFIIELWIIDEGIVYYLVLGNGQDLCIGILVVDEIFN